MIRFVITLLTPPAPNPPGWTLYGQEIFLGGAPQCSLVFPFAEKPEPWAHLYAITDELLGERLGEAPLVTMDGKHLQTSVAVTLPRDFTLTIGRHLLGVRWEPADLPRERATDLLALHRTRSLVTWDGEHPGALLMPHFGELLMGRGEECHLRLGRQTVSRRHASLVLTGGVASLVPRGGTTLVEGDLLTGPRRLSADTTFTLGDLPLSITCRPPGPDPRERA